METAQGEELYVAHNGEQMDSETAIQRCPFLSSFGETALAEMREELAAYRVPQEIAAGPQTAEETSPKETVKTKASTVALEVEGAKQNQQKNLESAESPPLAVEEALQALLAREALTEKSKKEPQNIQNIETTEVASTKPKPAQKSMQKARVKPEKHAAAVFIEKQETVEGLDIQKAQKTSTPVAEFEIPEPQPVPPAQDADLIIVNEETTGLYEPQDLNNSIETPTSGPLVLEAEEELFETEPAEIGASSEAPASEFQAAVTERFENLEPELAEAVLETLEDAYVIIEEMSEIINESAESEPAAVSEAQVLDVELAETEIELYVEELEAICGQLLERLELPAEPKNVRLVLRLLLKPDFQERLNLMLETYNKGTLEAKPTDTAALIGKAIDFAAAKESRVVLLGRWAVAYLSRLQTLASAA